VLQLINSRGFHFKSCVKAFGLSWRCLKEDNDVHDVPCLKCFTKVVLTLLSLYSILPIKVAIFERHYAKYKDSNVRIRVCAKYSNPNVSN
jgi:hypothetical protein